MKQKYRILLTAIGTLIILFSGVYLGVGLVSHKINWLGFILFTLGYTSLVISRDNKEK